MVTSVRTDRRTALAPDQAGRARALRLSGPSPTSSAGASSGSHRPACRDPPYASSVESLPHLREVRLELRHACQVGLTLQIAPKLALAQAQEHLRARPPRDPLLRRRRVELREKTARDRASGGTRRSGPHASGGARRGRNAPPRGPRARPPDPGARRRPRVPRARGGCPHREASGLGRAVASRRAARRRDPRERLARQIEPVGDAAARPPGARASPPPSRGSRGRGRMPPAGPRRARAPAGRGSGGSSRPGRAAARSRRAHRPGPGPAAATTIRISKPWPYARSIPRNVASSPAASASKQRYSRFVSLHQLTQVVLGQGRAHRCDDRLEPRLPQGDHVGVALDDDGAVLLRDRRPGEVEAVEDVALLEQLALGGVDVLPLQWIVVVELAGLEADHPAPRVGEREHQPRWEVVVAALVGQSGCTQLLGGEALLARLARRDPCPARGRAGTPSRSPRRARGPRGTREPARRRIPPRGDARRRRPPGRGRRRGALAAAATRLPAGELSSYSSATRNRSASHSIAPTKSSPSVSRTKVTTSPPLPQPKQ